MKNPLKESDPTEEAKARETDAQQDAGNPPLDDQAREERIAILAYFKSERRGFPGASQLDDWLEAEREIDSMSGSPGAAPPDAPTRGETR